MRKDGGLNQYEEGRGGKHIKKKKSSRGFASFLPRSHPHFRSLLTAFWHSSSVPARWWIMTALPISPPFLPHFGRHPLARHSSEGPGFPKRLQRNSSNSFCRLLVFIDETSNGIPSMSSSSQKCNQYGERLKMEKGNISQSVLHEQINLRNTVIEYNRFILSIFQIFMCFVGV